MPRNYFFKEVQKFVVDMKSALHEAPEFFEQLLLEEALAAFNEILERSPVDTGEYLRHWVLTGVEKRGSSLVVTIKNEVWNKQGSHMYASFLEAGYNRHGKWVEGRWIATIPLTNFKEKLPQKAWDGFRAFLDSKLTGT